MILLYTLGILEFLACACTAQSEGLIDDFVEDIISEYRLSSPTIILSDELPRYCIRPWVLCLSNAPEDNLADLIRHLTSIHNDRKQDGIIFIASQPNMNLVNELAIEVPSMFASNCPVFMPVEYDLVKLRLDSNICFFQEEMTTFKLIDKFAVKGGPPVILALGKWDRSNGIIFERSMNRWERRTDLKGVTLVNGKGWKSINFQRWYQDQLSYITDTLDMKTNTVIVPKKFWWELRNGYWIDGFEKNDSWIDLKMDVLTNGLGVNLARSKVLDYTIPTRMSSSTLLAQTPRGNAPNMWVFLQVFGATSWTIFVLLLLLFVIALTVSTILVEREGALASALTTGITMACMYTILQGNHPNGRQLAKRTLTFTAAMLTLFFFVCYSTDITGKMTFTGSEIPVRTFEDVIHHDYKVTMSNYYTVNLLKRAKEGSAKREVFKKYIHSESYEEALEMVTKDPKALFYAWEGVLVDEQTQKFQGEVYALKMDDATYSQNAIGLRKDSEFRQMFNYYLQKQIEHGINKRLYRNYHISLFVHEQFGMNEAQPMGLINTIFLFFILGTGIAASLLIATVERLLKKYILKV